MIRQMAMDYRRTFGATLERLARASGEIIVPYFQSGDFGLETKADASPVTLADRQAEKRMREIVKREFPDHGIIAEEFGNENEDAEYVWVFDPIDGTISFVSGCPLFGTLIGLLHRGEPVLGAIHQPVIGQLCIGDSETTTMNGRTVRVRECHALSEATLLTTDLENVARYQDAAAFTALRESVRLFRTWGDCYGYLLLATGGAEIMMDPILNPWDLLPVVPVIRGAGGVITAWDGSDVVKAESCLAASPGVHAQVLATLKQDR